MARLLFCDYHNMVVILEKGEHNSDFHPMVDFLEASPLRARIAQSSALLPVADEPTSPMRDVSQGEACPTGSSFIADQDRATITKSSTLPYDSAPRVTSPIADEGSMQPNITELKERVKVLEDREGIAATRSRDDAPIKGRSMDEGKVATERISDDTKEMAMVITSIDAAIVLAGGIDDVPTDSGSIPTAGPPAADIPTGSEVVPTASPVFATATVKQSSTLSINRLKERVKLLEDKDGVAAQRSGNDAPIKGRSVDEEEAAAERISDESEEMATVLTSMDAATVLVGGIADVSTGNESIPTTSPPADEVPTGSDVVPTASPVFATVTVIDAQVARELEKQLKREDQRRSEQLPRDAEIARIHIEKELQIMIDGLDRNNETSEQRKPWTKKQKRDYCMAVIRSNLGWKIEDFVPMGSKKEAKRFKRKGIIFEQESVKKQNISKEVPEEVKTPDKVPEEKVKEMMQLVPIEEVYVEALQVKHHIIDWKVYTKGQRRYWKITRLGGSSASY
nr:hypothetical protein [Tanacetum cinerariifolium]